MRIKDFYPTLYKIYEDTPKTVIDPDWEVMISSELLKDLLGITKCNSYRDFLYHYEGCTIDELVFNYDFNKKGIDDQKPKRKLKYE